MKELSIEAAVENIPKVTAFVDAELEAGDCPMKAQLQIDVAIDEIFANISYYAYAPGTGTATVRFELEHEPRAAVITFLDRGKPFNPLLLREPDTSLAVEDREIGGLGVFMVKKTMDEISYEFKDGQNILCMKKFL